MRTPSLMVFSVLFLFFSLLSQEVDVKNNTSLNQDCPALDKDCLQKGIEYYHEKQFLKAYEIFHLLCERKVSDGCNFIVEMSEDKIIDPKRKPQEYALRSCEFGSSIGCYNYGIYMEREKNSDKALEFTKKACEMLHNMACEKTGVYYSIKSNYVMAEKMFSLALHINPTSKSLFYNMACMYAKKGDVDKAINCLSAAIRTDSRYKEKAKIDEDFKSLKNKDEFKALLK